MIERYSLPEMSRLFTERAQWAAALEVELAAVATRAALGQISPEDAEVIRTRSPKITDAIVEEIAKREATTDHDVAAFVDVMQAHIDHDASRWFHFGLTSADVTDTALCMRLSDAAGVLEGAAKALLHTLCERAREFAHTPTAGRTHGQHAEVITFGVRIANWAEIVERAITTLRLARDEISVGKLSGACGTYTNIEPEVEAAVCQALGLRPITATQVIPRDLHANLVYACVRLANAIGDISFNIRTMASTEFGEVEERRREAQKGSSAMPHKRNPIRTEQLCGLTRKERGYMFDALQQTELLFERDISHSAPERIYLPDALILAYYMTVTLERVFRNLVVKPERMQANIDRSLGLMYTQTVLTTLVEDGMQRDDAYRLVQSLAELAQDEDRQLREILEESPQVPLTARQLDTIFDQSWMIRNCDTIIARLPM